MNRNNLCPTLDDDIATHAAYAYRMIYQYKYGTQDLPDNDEIAREFHGIQHVTRAAIFAAIFINLYRFYGDEEANKLTNEDVKLIQIAMLYHDSARLSEGEDLWDKESAINLYEYLTEKLKVPPEKAKILAEAVANKDCHAFGSTKDYYYELIKKNGSLTWVKSYNNHKKRNIFQKIIHDADCLDIQRAREIYNLQYLDIYQDKINNKNNEDILHILTLLAMETNTLIELQGDSFYLERRNIEIKKLFEHADVYDVMIKSINSEYYPLLFTLYQQDILSTTISLEPFSIKKISFNESESKYSANNLQYFSNNNRLLLRGIRFATGIYCDPKKPNKAHEISASIELRKGKRRPHIATRTKKMRDGQPTNLGKNGNENRSNVLKTERAEVFCPVNYIIVAELDSIKEIYYQNVCTGADKKNSWNHKWKKINQFYTFNNHNEMNASELPKAIDNNAIFLVGEGTERDWYIFKNGKCQKEYLSYSLEEELINKIERLAEGNDDTLREEIINDFVKKHNQSSLNLLASKIQIGDISKGTGVDSYTPEIIASLTEYGPAAFTQDVNANYPLVHRHSRKLEAIHLQKTRQKYYEGEDLPIFEFSKNWVNMIERRYTIEEIKKMWDEMTTDYIKNKLANYKNKFEGEELDRHCLKLFSMSAEEIKIKSMYGKWISNQLSKKSSNYSPPPSDSIGQLFARLQKKINVTMTMAEHGSSYANKFVSADIYYDEQTKNEINDAIYRNMNKLIHEHNYKIKMFPRSLNIGDIWNENISKYVKNYQQAILLKMEKEIKFLQSYAIFTAENNVKQVTISNIDNFIYFVKNFQIENQLKENKEFKKVINDMLNDLTNRVSIGTKNNLFLKLSHANLINIHDYPEKWTEINEQANLMLNDFHLIIKDISDLDQVCEKTNHYITTARLKKVSPEEQIFHLYKIIVQLILKKYQFKEDDFELIKALMRVSPFDQLGMTINDKTDYVLQLDIINKKLANIKLPIIYLSDNDLAEASQNCTSYTRDEIMQEAINRVINAIKAYNPDFLTPQFTIHGREEFSLFNTLIKCIEDDNERNAYISQIEKRFKEKVEILQPKNNNIRSLEMSMFHKKKPKPISQAKQKQINNIRKYLL